MISKGTAGALLAATALLVAPVALSGDSGGAGPLTLEVRNPASLSAARTAAAAWKTSIAVTSSERTDCDAAKGRAVLCYDSTITHLATAGVAKDGTCVIRVKHYSAAHPGIIAHEIGHCLGFDHAKVGVMSGGGGMPTAEDVAAAAARR